MIVVGSGEFISIRKSKTHTTIQNKNFCQLNKKKTENKKKKKKRKTGL